MSEIEVDTIDAEPLEAALDLAADPVRSEAVAVAAGHRVEDLGRDEQPVRLPGGSPAADERLARAAAVGIGGVEPADSALPGGVHDLERLVFRVPLPEERGRRTDAAEVAAAERDTRPGHP